jgi:hypothetical protein
MVIAGSYVNAAQITDKMAASAGLHVGDEGLENRRIHGKVRYLMMTGIDF